MGLFSFISKRKRKKSEEIPFAYADETKQSKQSKVDEGLKDESEMKPESKPVSRKGARESKSDASAQESDVSSSKKQEQVTAALAKNPQPDKIDTASDDAALTESSFEGETVSETGFVDGVTENGKPARTGTFEIKRAKDGRYVFNLYASNRVIIARSQIYSSSSSAITGIKSVISNAPRANIEDTTLKKPIRASFPKWEIYLDKAGQYRFRLYATNGDCICHSRGYTAKSSCKSGIQSIIRFATDAKINKIYLDNKG